MVALPVTATQVSSQSTSAMSAVTPYRPRVAAAPAQPTVFGVPMTQLCQAGSSHQSRRRGATNQEANATHSCHLNTKMMMVLFPCDVSLIFHI